MNVVMGSYCLLKIAGRLVLLGLLATAVACSEANDSRTYRRVGGDHLYLDDGSRALFWFNGVHSNDPQNIMFRDMQREFETFTPDLVLVEGGHEQRVPSARRQAILRGESAFAVYLAEKHDIPCKSIEPPDALIGRRLQETYRPGDILAMIIIRQMRQWQRETRTRPIAFEERVVPFARRSAREMELRLQEEITLGFLQQLLTPHTGILVSETSWQQVPAHEIVYRGGSVIHAIWQETIGIRNRYLVETIREKSKKYRRIFIMMGFDHARATRERIEELYRPQDSTP